MENNTDKFPSIEALAVLARRHSGADFAAAFRDHYLVMEAPSDDDGPERAFRTIDVSTLGTRGARAVGVIPVVKRPGVNPYASMITVGRARNNDITIEEMSMSKLHAWIRVPTADNGGAPPTITDAGSRNGTFVNGRLVGEGPTPLAVGARLRLGRVEFHLVDGVELHRTLRQLRSPALAA